MSLGEGEVQGVAATRPALVDEVQVVAGDGHTLLVVRGEEPGERAGHLGEGVLRLSGRRFGEGRVRPVLPGHGPCAHAGEVSVDPYRVHQVGAGQQCAHGLFRPGPGQRPRQTGTPFGPEAGHRREGGQLVAARLLDGAVGTQAVAGSAEDEHLAVEPVERAETEVAVPQQFGDGDVPVVDPREQGGHGRRLVQLRWRVAERRQVPQRGDEPVQPAGGGYGRRHVLFPPPEIHSNAPGMRCSPSSVLRE